MTTPRAALVSLEDTSWYHCVSRCVRRAFLCGEDRFSGKSFEHRRGWIAERILQLAGVFAIDVAAYAVMSNHYHVVVRIDRERALEWSPEEVLRRWTGLFAGPLLVTRYLSEARAEMCEAELTEVAALAELYRARLHDLSWFMRTLNEHVARQANAEDGVKGRFWEGRPSRWVSYQSPLPVPTDGCPTSPHPTSPQVSYQSPSTSPPTSPHYQSPSPSTTGSHTRARHNPACGIMTIMPRAA